MRTSVVRLSFLSLFLLSLGCSEEGGSEPGESAGNGGSSAGASGASGKGGAGQGGSAGGAAGAGAGGAGGSGEAGAGGSAQGGAGAGGSGGSGGSASGSSGQGGGAGAGGAGNAGGGAGGAGAGGGAAGTGGAAGAGGSGGAGGEDEATSCSGSIRYVSPSGDDAAGDGSQEKPWKTLKKATTAVQTAGETILLKAGTYLETEQSALAVGVCLEGEGAASTVVKSTLSAPFVSIVSATSPEGTVGHQHISQLTFDGSGRTTSWGVSVGGRGSLSIHDCVFVDFDETAVVFAGRQQSGDGPPSVYPTGNSFHSNTVKNSAKYDGYGRGALQIGGQEGMVIRGNTIEQKGRPKGTNGWPIKGFQDGYLRGVKIHDNTLLKEPYDGITWDFAIELFNVGGVEIFQNTIEGSIDTNHQTLTGYDYSINIHHNTIGPPEPRALMENGIILEFITENAIIADNRLRNLGVCFYFTPRPDSHIHNVTIRNNVCENVGQADGNHSGFGVRFDDGKTYTTEGFFVYNNVFSANPTQRPFWGVAVPHGPSKDVRVRNNVVRRFEAGGVTSAVTTTEGLSIENNVLFENGGNNEPVFAGGAPAGAVIQNNLTVDPRFVSETDFTLQDDSPCIDAGIEVGLPSLGAKPDIGCFEKK